MANDQFRDAVHCLSTYRWHPHPRTQLALLWSGIEGLFAIDYELSFRLGLYTARFLHPKNRDLQKRVFEEVKTLYRIRSKAVHGGKLKAAQESVKKSTGILLKIVTKCAEYGHIPVIKDLVP